MAEDQQRNQGISDRVGMAVLCRACKTMHWGGDIVRDLGSEAFRCPDCGSVDLRGGIEAVADLNNCPVPV